MNNALLRLYKRLVDRGRRTIDQVPEPYKAHINYDNGVLSKDELKVLVKNGNIEEDAYEWITGEDYVAE